MFNGVHEISRGYVAVNIRHFREHDNPFDTEPRSRLREVRSFLETSHRQAQRTAIVHQSRMSTWPKGRDHKGPSELTLFFVLNSMAAIDSQKTAEE
jgi:hypothetical protein